MGVKAFQQISDCTEELYFCPICLNGFSRNAIHAKILTLDHVPQKSIGGKKILLTCKNCNSESGHKFEADLKEREKINLFSSSIKGETNFYKSLKVNLFIGGKNIIAHVKIKNGRIELEIPQKHNNPANYKNFNKHIYQVYKNQSWSDEKFNITPDIKYNNHNANIADLKSAYLASFALLGYSYILNEEFDIIRRQILNPSAKLVENIFITPHPEIPKERKIIFMEEPFESILVQIDERFIFLPPINNANGSIRKIGKIIPTISPKTIFTGRQSQWPETLIMRLDFI